MTTELLIERDGAVGVATLNRPQVLNALSMPLMAALIEELERFDVAADIRVMIVAGSPRAFAAGADIKELQALADANQAEKVLAKHLARWDRVAQLNKPIIAAVSGFALGGGCELALACDLIIAAESAVFGLPEVSLGVIPGAGGAQRLMRAVGKALAMDMILTGRRLSAREALSARLAARVVADEALLDEAKALARKIAAAPPLAARAAKAAVNAANPELDAGLAGERKAFFRLFDTRDQKEGMRAFVEKRAPRFEGK